MSLNSRIPLALAKEGSTGVVVDIIGGRGAMSKLLALGIVPGKRIKVLGNRGGAILVAINGSKFVMGRGLAMKVMIHVEQKN
jgi:ferrous iron transport protein A